MSDQVPADGASDPRAGREPAQGNRRVVWGHCGDCGGTEFVVVERCEGCGCEEQVERLKGSGAAPPPGAPPVPSPLWNGSDVFLGIAAFCHHRAGCTQLEKLANCDCGLGEAQEALIAALHPPAPSPPAEVIAKLEALREQWRAEASIHSDPVRKFFLNRCADELDEVLALLRGTPEGMKEER